MSYIAVTTTIDNPEAAQTIARALLDRHLVACVQISKIESLYWWNGEIQQEPEYRILCKTIHSNYSKIEELIREHHTYDLPAIHSVAIEQIYQPYGEWITENCHLKT